MADKKPIKATYSGTDTNGLAEFIAADTIGVADGGTGLTTVATSNLLTGNETSALSAEANLTFDGTHLNVNTGAYKTTGSTSTYHVFSDFFDSGKGHLQTGAGTAGAYIATDNWNLNFATADIGAAGSEPTNIRMTIDTNGVLGVGQVPTSTLRIMQVKGAVSFGRGNSASNGAANMLSGFTGTLVADNSARSLLQSIGGAGVFAIVCGYTGDSNHSFMDVVASATGSFAVISSTTIEGSPGARTYSYASESLKVAINDSSTTYYVSVNALGTNEMANSTTPTIGA
jgi:hypothetical protein|tara:strand:- start:637 stop:1494 length:858 start_codon:yes stop_codon:yes gene_type:complete